MLTLGINNKPKLANETFIQIRDLIYQRCGIFFGDGKKYLLETRLVKRLEEKNLKSFEDYYYYLMYDRNRERELSSLFNSVVTNETSFFRDPVQLDVFISGVVPKVMEHKAGLNDRTLKVWSAACSTGEEPYTLAMMLLEKGLLGLGWTLEVIGSDISENVLRSAANAVYDKYPLRNMPANYLRKYFMSGQGSDSFVLHKKVQDMVRFRKINLMESNDTRSVKGMDVIFCRNVLIYFDEASKKKAVSHLYDSLAKGGYLFVGFSESLHNVTRLFRPLSIQRSLVYQKI